MDPRISRWPRRSWLLPRSAAGAELIINATPAAEPLVAEVYRETTARRGPSHPRKSTAQPHAIKLARGHEEQLMWVSPATACSSPRPTRHSPSQRDQHAQPASADPERQAVARRLPMSCSAFAVTRRQRDLLGA